MWIITHDYVHEAGINPAGNVPRSRDFLSGMTRKKADARRRIFRLVKGGRVLFRGIAYFENEAAYKDILRPLDEFGRHLYDCDAIEYQCGRDWQRVPEDAGRIFDDLVRERGVDVREDFLVPCGLETTTEASEWLLEQFCGNRYNRRRE